MRRWIALIIMALVIVGSAPVATEAVGPTPRVLVDGATVYPAFQGDVPLVPFKEVAEALDLAWDEENGMITASGWGTEAVLRLGEDTAKINGIEWRLDVPPSLDGGAIIVPLRFFEQAFGMEINWSTPMRTAQLSTKRNVHMLAFYVSGSYSHRFDLEYFDDVAMAWSHVDRSGAFRRPKTGSVHEWPSSGVEDLLAEIKENGTSRYLSVFAQEVRSKPDSESASPEPADPDQWYLMKLMVDPVRREKLADEIVHGVTEAGFDGVVLDFEEMGGYPKEQAKQAKEGYTAFVRAVTERMHLLDKRVGVALHAPGSFEGYDYGTLAQHADFIVLMAHDYIEKEAWDAPEPLNRVEGAIRHTTALGVAPEKILLASVLYYETPETLVEKAVLAKRYKLRGISLWHLGQLSAKHLLSLYDVIRPLR